MRIHLALWSALFLMSLGHRGAAVERLLSLDEAETLAARNNPSLAALRAQAESQKELASAARSRMLPSLSLFDEYQHWDSPVVTAVPIAATSASLTVRNADTHTFAASASQPLLGLWHLTEEHRAQHTLSAEATTEADLATESVRHHVRVAFLRYFEARALEDLAHQSEKELYEYVAIAQAKVGLGVLTNAELLRVQVAAGNAVQQVLVARSQAEVARSTVLFAAGLPGDEPIELQEPTALLEAAREPPREYRDTIRKALSARLEVRRAQLSIEAAHHQERARLLALLPELNLEGGYIHSDGLLLNASNAGYVGLKSTWLLWDSGATYFTYRAARQQTLAARQQLLSVERQVQSEVSAELTLSRAARSAVELAEQTLASAGEAHRTTEALLKAGNATTTDLLAAQSALSQARLNLVRARYQRALSYEAVAHAAMRN